MRESIASESVDLIYLDPPFNSQVNYNVLFKGPSGKGADAQIEAFEDTWHWGEQTERAFAEVLAQVVRQRPLLGARAPRSRGYVGRESLVRNSTLALWRPSAGRRGRDGTRPVARSFRSRSPG
jgi:hypothetical protein